MANPQITTTVTDDFAKDWWGRVDEAKRVRKDQEGTWDRLVKEYKPSVTPSGVKEDIRPKIHFRNVEQKKAQIFFRMPKVRLISLGRADQSIEGPEGPQQTEGGEPLQEDTAIPVHQEVLNMKLGPHGIDLSHLMDRVLTDCLNTTGLMATKLGFRLHTAVIQRPAMALQAAPQGAEEILLGMPPAEPQLAPVIGDDGQPVMEDVPIPVHSEYFWDKINPKDILIPATFRDTTFDKAPFLGTEFRIRFKDAKRKYNLPRDFKPRKSNSEGRFLDANNVESAVDDDVMVDGVEIFYRASLFQDKVINPEIFYQLVLLEGKGSRGKDTVVAHRMSPYQDVDETGHILTPGSMRGNPIHLGTLRDLTDTAYVPSDSAMTQAEVKELATYRRQTIQLRDANIPKFALDSEKVTQENANAMEHGEVGTHIWFKPGVLAEGIETAVAQITKGSQSRVDLEGAFQLESDIEKALAIGANQVGARADATRTATEVSTIQSNANVRLSKEQERALAYVVRGIAKFDSLIQMFADEQETVSIVGPDGQARLATWDKTTIAGRFLYEVVMDSQLSIDVATDRAQTLQLYNLVAQDPNVDRRQITKKVLESFGFDTAKTIVTPPEPPPTQPGLNIAIKGEDFVGPQALVVLELLTQAGLEFSQAAQGVAALAQGLGGLQPPHGGRAEHADTIDKNSGDTTGQLDGGGSGTGNPTQLGG